MDSTPPLSLLGNSALPPNPDLRGIHNAAITFITSTFAIQMRSLQRLTHGSPSKPPDTQLTFLFYLWVPFHIISLLVGDLAMSLGHAKVRRPTLAHLFPPQSSSTAEPALLYSPANIPRSHNTQTGSKNTALWQAAAINSTMIHCGRFSSNASVFISSNGKAELRRAGPSPDRQRNTNEITLCQLHLQPGWRSITARCLKEGERETTAAGKKKKDRDQYGLTTTPVSAGSNGQPYCISPGCFSLKWWGQNSSNAFDISVQPNRSSTQKSLRAWGSVLLLLFCS